MTRSTASRVAAGLAVATATFGGALLAAAPAAAAPDEPDSSRITAPDGLYVDVGRCTSSVDCGATALVYDLPAGDPSEPSLVDLPDWDSAVDDAYAPFAVMGANATYLYLRNDGGAPLSVGTQLSVDAHDIDETSSIAPLWNSGGELVLAPGEDVYMPLAGYSLWDNVINTMMIPYEQDPADRAVDAEYTIGVTTDQGPATVSWTGHPTGVFNGVVDNVTVTADSCTPDADGSLSGTLAFDLRTELSDLGATWEPMAREGDLVGTTDNSAFVAGISTSITSGELMVDTGWSESFGGTSFRDHLAGTDSNQPDWFADTDSQWGLSSSWITTGTPEDTSAFWDDGTVDPSQVSHYTDIPVSWDAATETFTFDGVGLNKFAPADIRFDTAQSPCA